MVRTYGRAPRGERLIAAVLLRPRYTMASERAIHDDYFSAVPSALHEIAA